jgi:hypothetical protein
LRTCARYFRTVWDMILCQSIRGPASEAYWRWRNIDGRTCWYKGQIRIDKHALGWGQTQPGITVEHKSARSERKDLAWGKADTPEVVIARKPWSDAELEKLITTPVLPAGPGLSRRQAGHPTIARQRTVTAQRIDGAFQALGMAPRGQEWLAPYLILVPRSRPSGRRPSSGDGTATVPCR